MFKAVIKTRYIPEQECILECAKYGNKVPALLITSDVNGPMMIASVNLDPVIPHEGAIFIKNWSENEGIEQCLEKLGLIGPAIMSYPTGFVVATEHMMQGDLLKEWKEFTK